MFCPKCGAAVPDNSQFCPKCGAPAPGGASAAAQPAPEPVPSPAPQPSSPKLSTKAVGIGIAVIAVIAVLLLAFVVVPGCTGGDPKGVVGGYVEATFKGDAKALWNLVVPEMREAALDRNDMDEDEFIDLLDDSMSYTVDNLDDYLGDDWTFTYEITDEDDLDEDDLDELKDNYSSWYDADIDPEAGKEFEVEVSISSADGETDESREMTVVVVKSGGKWYLANLA